MRSDSEERINSSWPDFMDLCVFIYLFESLNCGPKIELSQGSLRIQFPHAIPHLFIVCECSQIACQALNIARFEHESIGSVDNSSRQRPDVGDDHGKSACHPLEHRHSSRVGECCGSEDVGTRQQRRKLPMRYNAQEVHTVSDSKFCGNLFQTLLATPATCKKQSNRDSLLSKLCCCCEQGFMIVDGFQISTADNSEFRLCPSLTLRWTEESGIDSEETGDELVSWVAETGQPLQHVRTVNNDSVGNCGKRGMGQPKCETVDTRRKHQSEAIRLQHPRAEVHIGTVCRKKERMPTRKSSGNSIGYSYVSVPDVRAEFLQRPEQLPGQGKRFPLQVTWKEVQVKIRDVVLSSYQFQNLVMEREEVNFVTALAEGRVDARGRRTQISQYRNAQMLTPGSDYQSSRI